MKKIRYRWSDVEKGKEFEIIINRYIDGVTKQFGKNEFVIFNCLIDVGVDKPDLRECEMSLPVGPFVKAIAVQQPKLYLHLKRKKMRITLLKLGWNQMKITKIEEAKQEGVEQP